MELDDDGKRECSPQGWEDDTRSLLCILSAGIWVEHVGMREYHDVFSRTLESVEDVIEYVKGNKYRA